MVNVFWCRATISGTVTQADLDTWTAAFGAAYKSAFTASLPTQYSFTSVSATYFVDGTPTNVLQSTQALSGAGSATSTRESATAIVISWLSSAYWRGGKPRTYLMGPSTQVSATAQGQWASTFVTSVNTASGTFMSAVNGLTGGTTITGTAMGFVSFFTAGAARTPPLFFAFTGHKVHPRIAHQRRRDGKWVA